MEIFESALPKLIKKYPNQAVLIVDNQIEIFTTRKKAIETGYERKLNKSFFTQWIGPQIPANEYA